MNAAIISNMQGPTHAGERQLFELQGSGPVLYAPGVGDPINIGPTAFLSCVPGGFLSQSGNYELKPFPSITNNLRPQWAFKWFVLATGLEAAAVNLSGEVVQFFAIGGEM